MGRGRLGDLAVMLALAVSATYIFFFCRFCLISPFNSMNWPLVTFLLLLFDSYMCSLWYFVCYRENY